MFGYGGKQFRDNLHISDVVSALAAFHDAPRPAAVYTPGGGRENSCSVLEAISLVEEAVGRPLDWKLVDEPRRGDHRWWISDLAEFQRDYPGWRPDRDLEAMVREIHEANAERWSGTAVL